eukprot:scaffold308_cov327-Pavlova_lutheri.AAC.18
MAADGRTCTSMRLFFVVILCCARSILSLSRGCRSRSLLQRLRCIAAWVACELARKARLHARIGEGHGLGG